MATPATLIRANSERWTFRPDQHMTRPLPAIDAARSTTGGR
ncbi:hypothetical protein ABZ626_38120 [Streptomyces longispororuber]